MEDVKENSAEELLELVRSLKAQIQIHVEAGRTQAYMCTSEETATNDKSAADKLKVQGPKAFRKALTLGDVKKELGDCQRCSLGQVRTNIVFGEGNPKAEIVFVGEAPGGDEDAQGRPFVGRAGQLLTRIIEAMKLKRTDVYICNILKCRPPGNRNPRPEEIATCEPFLIKQLDAINPRVICALGTFAARTLLKTDVPITVLRGKFHSYHGIQLMPTYHPAYLLRNPLAKKQVWEDVQNIMKLLTGQIKD
jgi:uracil-DNA glycosylase